MEARPVAVRSALSTLTAGIDRVCILCAVLPACSASLPKPPTGRVPPGAMIEVPYPPPAARVEIIPPKTNRLDVWIDGQWEWDGKVWKWLDGAWMTPPANAYFTPWAAERRSDGRLFFARAAWRAKDGRPLDVDVGRDACSPLPRASRAGEVVRR
jgi:hypothetical protein